MEELVKDKVQLTNVKVVAMFANFKSVKLLKKM